MSITAKDKGRMSDLVEPLQELWDSGQMLIAGADEVGRGPLAGPVMAACVIMPRDPLVYGVYDSKQVSAAKRQRLADEIREAAVAVGIGSADPAEIDDVGISEAARMAFRRSIEAMIRQLGHDPDYLFTDSVKLDCPFPVTSMIRADQHVYPVAAASIVAKVARDALMTEGYAKQYPQYGFEKHKGYGTAEHRRAIIEYGDLPVHRKSFLTHLPAWKAELGWS